MLGSLIPALFGALLVCMIPGWFWAATLRGDPDFVERLTFSTAFSLALVPPVALAVMWASGTGVTILVSITALLVVLLSGLAVYLRFGPAPAPGESPVSPPLPLNPSALLAFVPALGLVLWITVSQDAGSSPTAETPFATVIVTAVVALFVLLTAILALRGRREPRTPPGSSWSARIADLILFPVALAVVLGAVAVRGYAGPVLYDWPYLRGGDQYNHAVQANEMLSVGHYDAFLVYPPGFSTITASVSRVSGLEPLEVFPVLAPALILLPAVACYALAKDLWGRWAGLAAAGFSGLLLNGTWENIVDARYPNLVSAQFLLVLVVAALIRLYRSPGPRSALTLALIGSSVVLYHSVGTFYTVLLLAPIGLIFVPLCLLLRDRRRGVALLFSLMLLGVLSVPYAWDTYDLGQLLGGLLTGTETGAGGEAVSITVGTQPTFPLIGLPGRISQALFWFALLGLLLLPTPAGVPKGLPGWLSRFTLLLWVVVLFAGSRTALSGFPQRFERDLGVALSVIAAAALISVLRSVAAYDRGLGPPVKAATAIAGAVAVLALSLVGTQAWASLDQAATPEPASTLTPEVAAAGDWLREHNSGGRILPTPSYGPVKSRGMLAMGGYEGLQAYPERRVRTPRSLPPGGAQEIKDAYWMLRHPQEERAQDIIKRYNLRYVVLSKDYPGIDVEGFESGPYRQVFENEAVVVFKPSTQQESS